MAIPSPAINQLIRASFVSYLDSQIGLMSSAWRIAALGGAGLTLQAMCGNLLTIGTIAWANVQSPVTILSGVLMELIDPVTGVVLQSAKSLDGITAGSVGTDCAPKQAAAIIQKRTGLAGRKNRGRAYFPFIPADFLLANGELTGAARVTYGVSAVILLGDQVLTFGGNSVTMKAALFHKGVPVTTTDITGYVVGPKIGTQKRRGDYGRTNPPL